jgi:hypothetical protein
MSGLWGYCRSVGNVERRVWREARAMTRSESMIKAIAATYLGVQASEILGVRARHLRRLRRKVDDSSATSTFRGGT